MQKKTPRQRRKIKNRNAILDVAIDLISKKGFENLSLREIAKEADYSPAALYKYFENKQAIVEAVLVRENRKLIERLAQVPDHPSFTKRLIDMCLIYIQFNLDNRAYLALVNNMTSTRRTKAQDLPQDSPFSVFLKAVSDWVEKENILIIEEYGLDEITYALWAQTHGMATLRLNQLKDFKADFSSINRRTLEIFLNGLKG